MRDLRVHHSGAWSMRAIAATLAIGATATPRIALGDCSVPCSAGTTYCNDGFCGICCIDGAQVCMPSAFGCVQCVSDSNCQPPTTICDVVAGTCVTGCGGGRSCGPCTSCDATTGRCIDDSGSCRSCAADCDCRAGETCVSGNCIAGSNLCPGGGSRSKVEQVIVSAPIFPDIGVLRANSGANFPTTLAGELEVVRDAALLYSAGNPPLSQSQLETNYAEVAWCAYVFHGSKPFWTPQLIADVDVCGSELGPGWRLPTTADVASFTESDFRYLHDTLAAADSDSFGGIYFSLHVFVRDADGAILAADLNPGVTNRLSALIYNGTCNNAGDRCSPKYPYTAGGMGQLLALRCVHRALAVPL